MKKPTAARPFLRVGIITLLCLAFLAGLGRATAPAQAVDGLEFVYATGLDRGPISPLTETRITTTTNPAVRMEWQTIQTRTGAGAYHLVGGNIASGDADIINQTDKTNPANNLAGLEVWIGGAFRFAAFPNAGLRPTFLMATTPTDGVAGADNKPLVQVTPAGRLRLTQTNSGTNFKDTTTVLARDHWYYVLLHGKNGTATQQLFLYDGVSGALVESLDLVGTVSGTYRNQLSKWGFGTYGDSTGLDYYLDDLFFARGPVNPGPVRVATMTPTSSLASAGFSAVGAVDQLAAVKTDDADTAYLRIASTTGVAQFQLAHLGLTASDAVYALQTVASQRVLTRGGRDSIGVKLGSTESLASVSLGSTYGLQQQVLARNPVTSASWTPAEVDLLSGVIRDTDASTQEIRVTTAAWEVVYRDT
jgi:hypothetical protein